MSRILCIAVLAVAACSSPLAVESSSELADNPVLDELLPTLICTDSAVGLEIEIQHRGSFVESDIGLGALPTDDPENRIRITAGDETATFNQNVVVFTDGAGNDTYDLFYVTGHGVEIPISLHYEHEGALLYGYYSFPIIVDDLGEEVLMEFGPQTEFGEVPCEAL